MALSTYTDLQTAVANWLARVGDTAITSNAPDFITLAEQRMFYGYGQPGDQFYTAPLRVRQMEQSTTLSTVAGTESVALPSGWLAGRRLFLDGDPDKRIDYLTPNELYVEYPDAAEGEPKAYTIEGENIVFRPVPDGVYSIAVLYYKKPDPLATTPTNALLTAAPGLYLYSALLEAALFLMDDAAATRWLSMCSAAANGISGADASDRHSGGLLTMRTTFPTP